MWNKIISLHGIVHGKNYVVHSRSLRSLWLLFTRVYVCETKMQNTSRNTKHTYNIAPPDSCKEHGIFIRSLTWQTINLPNSWTFMEPILWINIIKIFINYLHSQAKHIIQNLIKWPFFKIKTLYKPEKRNFATISKNNHSYWTKKIPSSSS